MRKLLIVTALLLFAGITSGQTLQKGNTIAIHEYMVTLDPDITMNQFMDFFMNKYLAEANKLFEGVKFFALKGDRGEHENGFALLVWCESKDARDKYWPEAGSVSDEFTAIGEQLQPLVNELGKMGTTTSVYTEWMVE